MKLKEFAVLGGCKVVVCGPGWSGKYGYTTEDAPTCTTCGFKTKRAAYEGWVKDTFGTVAGAAVMTLLDEGNPA